MSVRHPATSTVMVQPTSPAIVTAEAIHRRLESLRATGHVRLDGEEIVAIAHAVDGVSATHIHLFGSRARAGSRGGDVDLLVFTHEPAFETSQRIATRFFDRCEERIDVVVMQPDQMTAAQKDFVDRLDKVAIA
jgi:predicted nucleotidyltransferase